MRGHAIDLGFEQLDAGIEFVQRIAVEAFAGEQAGGIAARFRSIIIVHCTAASDALRLLSTGSKFSSHMRIFAATGEK